MGETQDFEAASGIGKKKTILSITLCPYLQILNLQPLLLRRYHQFSFKLFALNDLNISRNVINLSGYHTYIRTVLVFK